MNVQDRSKGAVAKVYILHVVSRGSGGMLPQKYLDFRRSLLRPF